MLARLAERTWLRVTGPYRALDLRFAVRVMSDDLADYLETLFAPFETDEPARHLYSVVDHGERSKSRFAVYYDGQRVVRTTSEPLALALLLWHVNRAVVAESQRYLLIHASAASHNGFALVFPAPMESGKTTLVAGLLQRGFGYVTDEAVAIDPESMDIEPYPKPLSVDPGSWEVLAGLQPHLEPRVARYGADQWHVVPAAVRPGAVANPCPPRLVISPRYQAGATTTLEPVSRGRGVLMLAENSFNFGSHGAAGLDTLAAVVRRCECYRLTFGSLDDACDSITSLVASVEAQTADGNGHGR